MTEPKPMELTEDRVPLDGIEESIDELVDMYGGAVTATRAAARDFTLPLRRGGGGGGAVECTVSWAADGVVTMVTNRNVDAPKAQRIMLLVAGIVGAVMFMIWPFFPSERGYGTLAWLGGIVAIAVYLMTLRRSSGGIAFDFLQRLAARQRAASEDEESPSAT
jgi:hypothetical protein